MIREHDHGGGSSRFLREVVTLACVRCGTHVVALRWADDQGNTRDTCGYMDFDDPGPVCDSCLGERCVWVRDEVEVNV